MKNCTRFSNWGKALFGSETSETDRCMIRKAMSGSWMSSNSKKNQKTGRSPPGTQAPPRLGARRHGNSQKHQPSTWSIAWTLKLSFFFLRLPAGQYGPLQCNGNQGRSPCQKAMNLLPMSRRLNRECLCKARGYMASRPTFNLLEWLWPDIWSNGQWPKWPHRLLW